MKSSDIICERFDVEGIDGLRVVEIIEILQRALSNVPAEYRNDVRLIQDAYDWGETWLEVDRHPNAAEMAESARLIADRAALIEKSEDKDISEWVRRVRVERHCSREEAIALIEDGTEGIYGHPKYNRVTKTIIL